jgi:hypothetical protein
LQFSDFSLHIKRVLYPADVSKLALFSDRIRIFKDLSDVSLNAGVSILEEIGYHFNGEYESVNNGALTIAPSYDKYAWQNKSKDFGAVFVHEQTGEKRIFGKNYFDKVEGGKLIAESTETLYLNYCKENNYDFPLVNITALLKFANKMKIKTNLNSFRISKVIRKAPKESIEILKAYGFKF